MSVKPDSLEKKAYPNANDAGTPRTVRFLNERSFYVSTGFPMNQIHDSLSPNNVVRMNAAIVSILKKPARTLANL